MQFCFWDEVRIAADLAEELNEPIFSELLREIASHHLLYKNPIRAELFRTQPDPQSLSLIEHCRWSVFQPHVNYFAKRGPAAFKPFLNYLHQRSFRTTSVLLQSLVSQFHALGNGPMLWLIQNGEVSFAQLVDAMRVSKIKSWTLENSLAELGYSTEQNIANCFSWFHKIPFVDLTNEIVSEQAIRMVPESIARSRCLLPLQFFPANDLQPPRIVVAVSANAELFPPFDLKRMRDPRPSATVVCEIRFAIRAQILRYINNNYGYQHTVNSNSLTSIIRALVAE